MKAANIPAAFAEIPEHWDQRTIAEANGQVYKLAKGLGATRWHAHPDQDELFLVWEGELRIELRDLAVRLGPGDVFVVPRGDQHRTIAQKEAAFLVVGMSVTSNAEGGKP